VPDINEAKDALLASEIRMNQAMQRELMSRRQRLNDLMEKRVMQSPKYYIDDKRLMMDYIQDRLSGAMQKKIYTEREKYARLAASLDAMSPLKVLGRGYAIARHENGKVIKKAADVNPGDRITLRVKKDEITCVVE
jgi:exodeoxyribonuclease VII large subunit